MNESSNAKIPAFAGAALRRQANVKGMTHAEGRNPFSSDIKAPFELDSPSVHHFVRALTFGIS